MLSEDLQRELVSTQFAGAHRLWTGFVPDCPQENRLMNGVPVGNPPGGSEERGMTTDETYTLILTKGTHLISGAAAETVRSAIQAGEALVHIELDPFGNVDPERTTTIAVRHVVALTKNAPALGASSTQNLAAFRGRRAGR